jgi:hypothetical protein
MLVAVAGVRDPDKKKTAFLRTLLEFSVGRITKVSGRSLTMRTTNFQWFSIGMDKSSEMNNTAQLSNETDHLQMQVCM